MTTKRELRRVAGLYKSFREKPATRARAVQVKLPKAAAVVGHLEAIEYFTTHGKRSQRYRHKFAPGSRPLLVAGVGTGQLFLIGGRYRFTDRGIVDLNSRGQEIDD